MESITQQKIMNQKGFSLVEMMIVVGIMSVAMLGFSQFFLNQLQALNYVEDKQSYLEFRKRIFDLLADTTICTQSLQTVNKPSPNTPSPFEVKDDGGQVLYSGTNQAQSTYDKIAIKSIEITTPVSIANNTSTDVDLDIRTQRLRSGGGPLEFSPITAKIKVQVDGSGQIVSCASNTASIDCLERMPPLNLSGAATIPIPSDAKAVRLSAYYSHNAGNTGGCTSTITYLFPINGKQNIGSNKLTHNHPFVRDAAGAIYYRGYLILPSSSALSNCPTPAANLPSIQLPICNDTNVFSTSPEPIVFFN